MTTEVQSQLEIREAAELRREAVKNAVLKKRTAAQTATNYV